MDGTKNIEFQKITDSFIHEEYGFCEQGIKHWKMGIAIAFYVRSREKGKPEYEEWGGKIIDEIYNDVSDLTPIVFENGLAGIGWGIEYLVQNHFLEADTGEVLEELDNRLMKFLLFKTPSKIGLSDGILGIGIYFLIRIQNPSISENQLQCLILKELIIFITDELDRITENKVFPAEYFLNNRQNFDYPVLVCFLINLLCLNLYPEKVIHLLKRLITPIEPFFNQQTIPCFNELLIRSFSKLLQNPGFRLFVKDCGNDEIKKWFIDLKRLVTGLNQNFPDENNRIDPGFHASLKQCLKEFSMQSCDMVFHTLFL